MQMQGILCVNARAMILRRDAEYRCWVYVIASKPGTLCTGITGDLYIRTMQHKAGEIKGFSQQPMHAIAWFITLV